MDRRENIGTSCSGSNSDNNSNSNNNNNTSNVIISKKNKKNKKWMRLEMQWTNEKHSDFLRLMEASFVRNLMEKSSNEDTTKINSRLDRFVPDISESTLDLHHRSAHSSDRVNRTCNRQKERGIIRPYKMTHDQVVPRVEDKAGDKNTTN
ncbi:myb-like protein D [Chenopodium quinoa]|uniref:myb-like protein D n=1 Tax=Chenopodium quinoa TaxID=63459 RepID=UPI000B78E1A0|nr:myb-like protein D [Chenopodium quinoa]